MTHLLENRSLPTARKVLPRGDLVNLADPHDTPCPSPAFSRKAAKATPPAILLGGGANALSVARNLGRAGVTVYSLNEPGEYVRYSRYCRPIDAADWAQFLLSDKSDGLRGAVVLACCDAGIQTLVAHGPELCKKYLLDDCNPAAQQQMLNKLTTYEAALEAGVPTPRFWLLHNADDLPRLRRELIFPLIVKPRFSHIFENRTGKKFVEARTYEHLAGAVADVLATGSDIVLMEKIPGPDDRLCSYFTYLDENNQPLFHFTKRVVRRYQPGMGGACYHITDWIPELVEISNRLFSKVKLRGLANIEFKRDPRDDQYKLIECNARFTASDSLVTRSGVNLALFVYNRLTGRPLPAMDRFKSGLRQWDPVRDFQSCIVLRRQGEMTYRRWFRSILHRQSFPYFHWSDPLPALMRLTRPLRCKFGLGA